MKSHKMFAGALTATIAMALAVGGCTTSDSKEQSAVEVTGEGTVSEVQSDGDVVTAVEYETIRVNKDIDVRDAVDGAVIDKIEPGDYIIVEESGSNWVLLGKKDTATDSYTIVGWADMSEEGAFDTAQSE